MKNSPLLYLLLFITLLSPPTWKAAAAQEADPGDVVKRLNDALLQAMKKGDQVDFQERYQLLEPVISEAFALPFMARVSTGRYWRELDGEQRKTYLEKYRQWTIASYANRFDDYSGQKFDILSPEEEPTGPIVDVRSTLTKANGEQIFFTCKVRKAGAQWRIVDVQVKGVSQLALTRTQFVDIFKKDGFDGLIALLDEKIESLAAEPEAA